MLLDEVGDCDRQHDDLGNEPTPSAASDGGRPWSASASGTATSTTTATSPHQLLPHVGRRQHGGRWSLLLSQRLATRQWATNEVGPLGDHGGHAWTMLPLPLTPLLDNPWADANCQPEDQRLVTRPQSGLPGAPIACDTGAVELRQEDLTTIFTDGFETGNTSAWQ